MLEQFLMFGVDIRKEPMEVAPIQESPVVEDEEAKGKSVDFVFPELSPDKQ